MKPQWTEISQNILKEKISGRTSSVLIQSTNTCFKAALKLLHGDKHTSATEQTPKSKIPRRNGHLINSKGNSTKQQERTACFINKMKYSQFTLEQHRDQVCDHLSIQKSECNLNQPSSIHDSHPAYRKYQKSWLFGKQNEIEPCPTLCSIINSIWPLDLNVKSGIFKTIRR